VVQKTVEVSLSEHVAEKLHDFDVQERKLAKLVKEIARLDGDISKFVPPLVRERVLSRMGKA
ncbi:MAG: hypothetical protein ACPG4J_09205, partial [Lentibacter algarum]